MAPAELSAAALSTTAAKLPAAKVAPASDPSFSATSRMQTLVRNDERAIVDPTFSNTSSPNEPAAVKHVVLPAAAEWPKVNWANIPTGTFPLGLLPRKLQSKILGIILAVDYIEIEDDIDDEIEVETWHTPGRLTIHTGQLFNINMLASSSFYRWEMNGLGMLWSQSTFQLRVPVPTWKFGHRERVKRLLAREILTSRIVPNSGPRTRQLQSLLRKLRFVGCASMAEADCENCCLDVTVFYYQFEMLQCLYSVTGLDTLEFSLAAMDPEYHTCSVARSHAARLLGSRLLHLRELLEESLEGGLHRDDYTKVYRRVVLRDCPSGKMGLRVLRLFEQYYYAADGVPVTCYDFRGRQMRVQNGELTAPKVDWRRLPTELVEYILLANIPSGHSLTNPWVSRRSVNAPDDICYGQISNVLAVSKRICHKGLAILYGQNMFVNHRTRRVGRHTDGVSETRECITWYKEMIYYFDIDGRKLHVQRGSLVRHLTVCNGHALSNPFNNAYRRYAFQTSLQSTIFEMVNRLETVVFTFDEARGTGLPTYLLSADPNVFFGPSAPSTTPDQHSEDENDGRVRIVRGHEDEHGAFWVFDFTDCKILELFPQDYRWLPKKLILKAESASLDDPVASHFMEHQIRTELPASGGRFVLDYKTEKPKNWKSKTEKEKIMEKEGGNGVEEAYADGTYKKLPWEDFMHLTI